MEAVAYQNNKKLTGSAQTSISKLCVTLTASLFNLLPSNCDLALAAIVGNAEMKKICGACIWK
jgi:hypothetical protein